MKKVLLCTLVLCAMVWMVPAGWSAGTIGFIDVQRVFKEFKETSKAQESFAKEEETYKKELEESQKKIEEAKKNKKADAEVEKMAKDLEEKLTPKRQRLLSLNEQLTKQLQESIVKSCNEVAKNLGIEVVVDKQVVISGGMDVTEMVINKLNQR